MLEAIHILSTLRSFRTNILHDTIYWNNTQAYIRGEIRFGDQNNQPAQPAKTLAVNLQTHARTSFINSKQSFSSKEYLRIFPTVAFIPDELDIVKGAPSSRRYFLDKGTFQCYPFYWSLLTDYNKVLRQKNMLLRNAQQKGSGKRKQALRENAGDDSYPIWDTQLHELGSKIIIQRLRFMRNLQRLLMSIYANWIENKETVTLHYKSSVGLTLDVTDFQEEQAYPYILQHYQQAAQENQEREYRLGTTVIGPHRDDLELRLSGKPLRAFGSQGQQKTAVLALKLAEAQLYYEEYAEYPVFLLDDVTAELDVYRNEQLLKYLHQGMQVFISTTEKMQIAASSGTPCAYFDLSETSRL